jgi:2-polyprenyl-3-methyl-5-hydroxy-6-metoxy-1,4-benzoquinol methylase
MSLKLEDEDAAIFSDLFLSKDYKLIQIHSGNHCISLKLLQSACTDFDLTGQVLWPGARLLSDYLTGELAHLIDGKRCIELGAGTGLCSLFAGLVGAKEIWITDHNDTVLELIRENAELNQKVCENTKVEVEMLEWGSRLSEQRIGGFDVVLGADVMYSPNTPELLMKSVRELMNGTDSWFLLSYVSRWKTVDEAVDCAIQNLVQSELEKYKWDWTKLPPMEESLDSGVPVDSVVHVIRRTLL